MDTKHKIIAHTIYSIYVTYYLAPYPYWPNRSSSNQLSPCNNPGLYPQYDLVMPMKMLIIIRYMIYYLSNFSNHIAICFRSTLLDRHSETINTVKQCLNPHKIPIDHG